MHPFEWPAQGGHLSDLTGDTHDSRYAMFADGRTATGGLKLVAEKGRLSILETEFAEARRRNRVGEVIYAEKLKNVPGPVVTEFDVHKDRPLLSCVSMLAPSPDWFTGAASVRLYDKGAWRQRMEGPLMAWDAGTDSGSTYLADNMETQPAESIRLIATPHFLTDDGLPPVGRYVLERIQ